MRGHTQRVIRTGAESSQGFVGFPTCEAFCRAGHIVYGQTRSASSAQKLAEREIVPIICDPLTDQGRAVWGEIAARVDVGGSRRRLMTNDSNSCLPLMLQPAWMYAGDPDTNVPVQSSISS